MSMISHAPLSLISFTRQMVLEIVGGQRGVLVSGLGGEIWRGGREAGGWGPESFTVMEGSSED